MLERALAANRYDSESWSQLAHNQLHLRRHEEAARCFARAAEQSRGRDFGALLSLSKAATGATRPLAQLRCSGSELLQLTLVASAFARSSALTTLAAPLAEATCSTVFCVCRL